MKTTIVSGNNIMRPVTAGQKGQAERSQVVKAEKPHSAATPVVKAEKQCRPVTYGYIRVSTREQNEARQVDAMKKFGVDQMVMDKQSGKDFDRPSYQALMEKLQPGDVLVVKSIDRLGAL